MATASESTPITPEQSSEAKPKGKVITEAQSRAAAAKSRGGKDGKVKIKLAHPISREQDKRYLGLDVDGTYEVNDEVEVSVNGAQALIGSGLAQVDTEDPDAVAKALSGK